MKILALLLILIPLKTFAMENDGGYTTGASNCGEYVSEYKKQQTARSGKIHNDFGQTAGQIAGFISAWNYLSPNGKSNITATTTIEGVELWLNNWCNKNPLDHHYNGLIELMEELEGDGWKHPVIWKDGAEYYRKAYLEK